MRAHQGACKAKQPDGGPLFGDYDDESVRVTYAGTKTWIGIDSLLKELDAVDVGSTIRLRAQREFKYQHSTDAVYDNGMGRLHQFDRHQDVQHFANAVDRAARFSGAAQRAHFEKRKLSLSDGTPTGHMEGMASAFIRRWLPAIQNIVSRLHAEQRVAAAEHGQILGELFLSRLGGLHTLARKIGDECSRWAAGGVGATDVAVFECALLIHYAHDLASNMEDDGTDTVTGLLRLNVAEAWDSVVKALARLSDERLEVLRLRAYRDKAGMLAVGRAGGITPAGAARYFAKGSAVPGY